MRSTRSGSLFSPFELAPSNEGHVVRVATELGPLLSDAFKREKDAFEREDVDDDDEGGMK